MRKAFQTHIDSNFPELRKHSFIIAISGGVDSVVLASLAKRLNLDFALAHCNFQLREESSNRDEAFVKKLAERLDCPLFLKRFQTQDIAEANKKSIQVTARNLRYHWFEELIDSENYKYLLTAHHLNDQLETFIINLSRGTGLKGLSGIPPHNNYIRRPLLQFSKEDILNFARAENIAWREDQSNASTKYLRNQIRHEVVPSLSRLKPHFLQNFEQTLHQLQQTEALLEDYTSLLFKNIVNIEDERYYIDLEKLQSYTNIKGILYQLLHSYGFSAWDDILNLCYAETGRKIYSNSHVLLKDRGVLILMAKPSSEPINYNIEKHQKELKLENTKFQFDYVSTVGNFSKNVAYLDVDKLSFPLNLRKFRHGDIFFPLGMQNRKKLSDFLKDEKVNWLDKQNQLLFCDRNQNIIWVVNHRIDERYKIDHSTKQILKITCTR